jgi:hypothetical protein
MWNCNLCFDRIGFIFSFTFYVSLYPLPLTAPFLLHFLIDDNTPAPKNSSTPTTAQCEQILFPFSSFDIPLLLIRGKEYARESKLRGSTRNKKDQMANKKLFISSFQFVIPFLFCLHWSWFRLSIGYALVLILSLLNHGWTHDVWKYGDRVWGIGMLLGIAAMNISNARWVPLAFGFGIAVSYLTAKATGWVWPHAICHLCASSMGILSIMPDE